MNMQCTAHPHDKRIRSNDIFMWSMTRTADGHALSMLLIQYIRPYGKEQQRNFTFIPKQRIEEYLPAFVAVVSWTSDISIVAFLDFLFLGDLLLTNYGRTYVLMTSQSSANSCCATHSTLVAMDVHCDDDEWCSVHTSFSPCTSTSLHRKIPFNAIALFDLSPRCSCCVAAQPEDWRQR